MKRIGIALLLSCTAAHAAAPDPTSALFDALNNHQLDLVRAAITHHADVNAIRDGMTPLMWASFSGDGPTTELLLASGADPNLTTPNGDALHQAVSTAEDCHGAVAALLRHKANPNSTQRVDQYQCGDACTPLDEVMLRWHGSASEDEHARELVCYELLTAAGAHYSREPKTTVNVSAVAYVEAAKSTDRPRMVAGTFRVWWNGALVANREQPGALEVLSVDNGTPVDPRALYFVIPREVPQLVRRGTNTVRVEFVPADPKASYLLAFESAFDSDLPVPYGPRARHALATGDRSAEKKTVASGPISVSRDFPFDYVTDKPWHHYAPVSAISRADRGSIKALIQTRVDLINHGSLADVSAALTSRWARAGATSEGVGALLSKIRRCPVKVAAFDVQASDATVVFVRPPAGHERYVDWTCAAVSSSDGAMEFLAVQQVLADLFHEMAVAKPARGGWELIY